MKTTIFLKLAPLLLFPVLLNAQTQIGDDISTSNRYILISLSGDGNTVAIGDPFSDNNFNTGCVNIYENQSGSWVNIGNLFGNAPGDRFGEAVSLSMDGSTLAVGLPLYISSSGYGQPHVKVYKNQSGSWVQIGSDINGNGQGQFGFALSLSDDGNTIAIGDRQRSYVQIYENISGNWSQIGSDIIGAENYYDLFGQSICLSSDGSIVAIGVPADNGNGEGAGRVCVYKNVSGVWTKVGSDIYGDSAGDGFGNVSLSSDGGIVAIGAPGGNNSGHVRVYKNQSGSWVQVGNDINGMVEGEGIGLSVSLSGDGNILAASGGDTIVRIYKNQGGSWVQVGADINSGWRALSLSKDGSIVALGRAKVYDLSAVLSTESFKQDYFSMYPNPAKNILNIQLKSGLQLKQVNIYNIQSQYLYSVKSNKIDTQNLNTGIYFVEIDTNKGKSAKKLVVK
ncbi:T9SS type A sorting domain-containing protein [Tamlana flava]|uniref:T9SS type A sorting domain-containing protein n=1 Tax=Tamlana flava TaxID=3158572 RepID=UPI00351B75A1